MSWNFSTANFNIRLPVSDQDGDALYELLKQESVVEHIPRLAMNVSAQVLDELRRMAMRFDTKEAAFWLIEGRYDQQLLARIGIQRINWMMLNAQLQWELGDRVDDSVLLEVVPEIVQYCFRDLGLHRLEMRLKPGQVQHQQRLQSLGFEHEGVLPAQQEFLGEPIDHEIWSIINQQQHTN